MNERRSFIRKSLAGFLGFMAVPTFGNQLTEPVNIKDVVSNNGNVFKLLRQQLLIDSNLVYMNTGSLGPSPRQIVDKVSEITHKLERNPVSNNWGELGKEMERVRALAADFFNVDVDEIVLTRNTTEGLSMVGASLKLNEGDEILTTNHEHGGGEVGLDYMAAQNGATLRKIEILMPAKSEDDVVDLIERSISEKTKVLLLSHVVTITGLRMPIKRISRITKERGILFIVDGAQAPGMINIDLDSLGADVYATSGHKWLLAPKETGIVYISKAVQERIKPVFTASGYASYSSSSGTRNVANIIGLGEALKLHMLIGKDKIEEQVIMLSAYCRSSVVELPGLEVISPADKSISSAMVSVRLLEAKNRHIYQNLKELGIIVKLLPKENALRFSTHMFNTKEDIDKLTEKLEMFLG